VQVDLAETANIEKLVARIGAGLDQFSKFEHGDCLQSEAKGIWFHVDGAYGLSAILGDFGVPYFDCGVERSVPCLGVVVWALIRENQNLPSPKGANGKLAWRPCFVGARTNQTRVQSLLQDVLRIGQDLAQGLKSGSIAIENGR
jgi:hypothetical protein